MADHVRDKGQIPFFKTIYSHLKMELKVHFCWLPSISLVLCEIQPRFVIGIYPVEPHYEICLCYYCAEDFLAVRVTF